MLAIKNGMVERDSAPPNPDSNLFGQSGPIALHNSKSDQDGQNGQSYQYRKARTGYRQRFYNFNHFLLMMMITIVITVIMMVIMMVIMVMIISVHFHLHASFRTLGNVLFHSRTCWRDNHRRRCRIWNGLPITSRPAARTDSRNFRRLKRRNLGNGQAARGIASHRPRSGQKQNRRQNNSQNPII